MSEDRLYTLSEKYKHLPYMQYKHAKVISKIILEHKYKNLLEIGFYHGKSSLLIASIIESIEDTHLTTLDLPSALDRAPNIHHLLSAEELTEKVTVKLCRRSYTFELMEEIISGTKNKYDFCYFDGGHTIDNTGFGFYLVDKLLTTGGTIVFDDLNWSIAKHGVGNYDNYSEEEKEMLPVRAVFENLVKNQGYECFEIKELGWGVAKKL